ncbi:hypothetical protein BCU12_02905 [Vibrio sp. 10N.261.55.A7]|nr:hypothetical protein BCU12_02905 [Vibrio sp. 10N.261.55.A7]
MLNNWHIKAINEVNNHEITGEHIMNSQLLHIICHATSNHQILEAIKFYDECDEQVSPATDPTAVDINEQFQMMSKERQ